MRLAAPARAGKVASAPASAARRFIGVFIATPLDTDRATERPPSGEPWSWVQDGTLPYHLTKPTIGDMANCTQRTRWSCDRHVLDNGGRIAETLLRSPALAA
jgi:hypothetical protein